MSETRRRLLMGLASENSGGGGVLLANGTFTIVDATDLTEYEVEHDLGAVPNMLMCFSNGSVSGSTSYFKGAWHFENCFTPGGGNYGFGMVTTAYNNAIRGGGTGAMGSTYDKFTNIDDTYFTLATSALRATTYYWWAIHK